MADARALTTRCCVVGGGPAGIMLGFLLARAGIDVVVLEKHADFFRDFRGDTIHPSTLEILHAVGLLDAFLRDVPHQQVRSLGLRIGEQTIQLADFSHLPTACKFVALAPQWDFLNFLAAQARRYPAFHLEMNAQATGLLREGGRVSGVRATTPSGERTIAADLVVACDGRHSILRERSGLAVDTLGAPMDVLWARIPRLPSDPGQVLGYIKRGHMLVLLDRNDYFQMAYLIPKGGYDATRAEGLDAFRESVARTAPFLRGRLGALQSWDEVKLLTVAVDRLRTWHVPGLLLIGDAAHAMSPIGGVGVNYAVADAVAAANILTAPLRARSVSDADLAAVQARRLPPTRRMQSLQVLLQNRVLAPVLASGDRELEAPWFLRLFNLLPVLRRIPARFLGLGFRPELPL